jgi:hypothetical protein
VAPVAAVRRRCHQSQLGACKNGLRVAIRPDGLTPDAASGKRSSRRAIRGAAIQQGKPHVSAHLPDAGSDGHVDGSGPAEYVRNTGRCLRPAETRVPRRRGRAEARTATTRLLRRRYGQREMLADEPNGRRVEFQKGKRCRLRLQQCHTTLRQMRHALRDLRRARIVRSAHRAVRVTSVPMTISMSSGCAPTVTTSNGS